MFTSALSAFREVSYCPVEANGVPAEWVEATVATSGQPTLLYLLGHAESIGSRATGRAAAANLAVATGARVLCVWSRTASDDYAGCVEDGVTAYRWLLEEGVDLTASALIVDAASEALALAVLLAADHRGLPLPASWCIAGACHAGT